jgi:hypothetical protein
LITFFFADYLYLNPGMPLLYEELRSRSEERVRVCNVTELEVADLPSILAESSAVVIDTSIHNAATWVIPNKFSIYFVINQKSPTFYQEILDQLLQAKSPKVFALYVDIHDKKNFRLLETLKGRVDAICWNFEREPKAVADVPPAYRDSWLTDEHDSAQIWKKVRDYFPVRIDLPFALGRHEYYDTSPKHIWDVCVAGAPYLTRQIASTSIRAEGLSLAPFSLPSRLVAGATARILPAVLPTRVAVRIALTLQQSLQRNLVRSAPINFVCGGPLAFPVRKFFEIPASRSAMIAYPCGELEDYGFRDGVNFVAAEPEQVGRTARKLIHSSHTLRQIAKKAFDTVLGLHSVERRSTQLIECVKRLQNGRLRGAKFVNGQFEIS